MNNSYIYNYANNSNVPHLLLFGWTERSLYLENNINMHCKTMEDNLFPVAQMDTVQYMYMYINNQNNMYDTPIQQTTNDDQTTSE